MLETRDKGGVYASNFYGVSHRLKFMGEENYAWISIRLLVSL